MAFADAQQPGPQKQKGARFRKAFHLVREPLASITSPRGAPWFVPLATWHHGHFTRLVLVCQMERFSLSCGFELGVQCTRK